MSRWLVTGAGGMLGSDLTAALRAAGERVHPLPRAELDITDTDAVDQVVAALTRESASHGDRVIVVNAAAWTDVDGAEDDEAGAAAVNAGGARNVALACRHWGARMIQISTDYVFDGLASSPYQEGDPVAPCGVYGQTKATAEYAVSTILPTTGVVLRTAWLYGRHGRNFVTTVARRLGAGDGVEVVTDQAGQPTWTIDLARRVLEVGRRPEASGIYHATNSGSATWYELAQGIATALGVDPDRVRPVTSERFCRRAPRPAFSVLGHARWAELDLPPMRDWREALAEAGPSAV